MERSAGFVDALHGGGVVNCRAMADGVRKIYLCGPIMDAESDSAAKDWRTRAKERLAGRFILLDPLRRNFRDREIDSCK